jgi:hypothetical protein
VSFIGVVDDSTDALTDLLASWDLNGAEICTAAAPDASGITTCDAEVVQVDDETETELVLTVQNTSGATAEAGDDPRVG